MSVEIKVYTQKVAITEKLPEFGGKTLQEWIETEQNIATYCRHAVAFSFAQGLVDDSHVIMVAFVNGRPMAFAILQRQGRGHTLYLHLICAAAPSRTRRRSHTEALNFKALDTVGGYLIKYIQKFAAENGFKRVKLSALNAVITLYHKFGWRFIKKCGNTENSEITAAVGALWSVWGLAQKALPVDTIKAAAATEAFWTQQSETPGSAWRNLKMLLEKHGFSGATTDRGDTIHTVHRTGVGVDYSVGRDLREGQYQDQLDEEDAASTSELAHIDTDEHGFSMIWCVPKTAGSASSGGRDGGGRRRTRRRRRRRRRKTKRRRPRRRRRRRRRTRRRRR